MKAASQWMEENDNRIIHWQTVRAIQADALLHAASIVNAARSGETDLRAVRDRIKHEAADLVK